MNQLAFFDRLPQQPAPDADWSPDDWETPDAVARAVASLVRTQDCPAYPRDRVIVEAGAGTGQVARYLPSGSHAVELQPLRAERGRQRAPHCQWHFDDFLTWEGVEAGTVDLVIGNPPFSRAADFINRGLELLAPRGRVVFVLPCDTFHKPTFLDALACPVVVSDRRLVGRVAFLQNGKPYAKRQCYDSIFIIQRSNNMDLGIIWL